MTISKEILDELLSGVDRPEDLLGDKGLMKELKVRLMERMLGAELTEHLGTAPSLPFSTLRVAPLRRLICWLAGSPWGVSEALCIRLSPCGLDGSFIEPFWV